MPVMLAENECHQWLDNGREIPPDDPLFRPELKYNLTLYPVDKAMGNARNKAPELQESNGEVVKLGE